MTDQKKTRRQMLEEFVAKDPTTPSPLRPRARLHELRRLSRRPDTHFRQLLARNADYVAAYLMYAQLLVPRIPHR